MPQLHFHSGVAGGRGLSAPMIAGADEQVSVSPGASGTDDRDVDALILEVDPAQRAVDGADPSSDG